MRETEVSRFIPTTPARLDGALSPAKLVEYEGSFEPRKVVDLDSGTRVIAGRRGLEMGLFFETLPDGYRYEQEGSAGPFDEMETTITYEPENEGTRVWMRSAVALDLFPRRLTGRVAVWKRESELERALDAIEDELS